nr:MAG TPA: hypothetical protein [Caudoviricetes sp.]
MYLNNVTTKILNNTNRGKRKNHSRINILHHTSTNRR